jgi:hypothetical protein
VTAVTTTIATNEARMASGFDTVAPVAGRDACR